MDKGKLDQISKQLHEALENMTHEDWEKIEYESAKKQKEAEEAYNGDFRDMCWLMTSWSQETHEYGCPDTHIFATTLVRLIDDRGFEIVKKKQ